ncbi:MAG: hypothetical protein ACUVRO_12400, partial [Armatimonadota bacterium]
SAENEAIKCSFKSQQGIPLPLTLRFRVSGPSVDVFLERHGGMLGEVTLFGDGLVCPASEDGAAIVPVRLGLMVPAAGVPFERFFGTYDYEGCHMAMLGLLKGWGGSPNHLE